MERWSIRDSAPSSGWTIVLDKVFWVSPIDDVAARTSRGCFELVFTRAADPPSKVEVLCYIDHGPVLRENGCYARLEMAKVLELIARHFP